MMVIRMSRIIALIVFLIFLFGCLTPEYNNNTNNLTKLDVKSAFENFAQIPKKYTFDGDNAIPPFEISGIPPNAKSIAVIVEDPDAPSGLFVHLVAWNLPPTGKYPEANSLGGKEGVNSAGQYGYIAPCPPPGPAHRYFFKFYALDSSLNLSGAVTREQLLDAMSGHIIAEGKIVGKYSRN